MSNNISQIFSDHQFLYLSIYSECNAYVNIKVKFGAD